MNRTENTILRNKNNAVMFTYFDAGWVQLTNSKDKGDLIISEFEAAERIALLRKLGWS